MVMARGKRRGLRLHVARGRAARTLIPPRLAGRVARAKREPGGVRRPRTGSPPGLARLSPPLSHPPREAGRDKRVCRSSIASHRLCSHPDMLHRAGNFRRPARRRCGPLDKSEGVKRRRRWCGSPHPVARLAVGPVPPWGRDLPAHDAGRRAFRRFTAAVFGFRGRAFRRGLGSCLSHERRRRPSANLSQGAVVPPGGSPKPPGDLLARQIRGRRSPLRQPNASGRRPR